VLDPRGAGGWPRLALLLALALAFASCTGDCFTGGDDEGGRGGDDDDDSGDDDTDDDDDDEIPPGALVDTAGDVGKYSSLELVDGNAAAPRISYYGDGVGLKFAATEGTAWRTAIVDSTADEVGLYTSLRLDSGDLAHIAYYDKTNGMLKYARGDETDGWDIVVVDSGEGTGPDGGKADVGAYASLDLTPGEEPMVVYYDASSQNLKFALRPAATETWEFETVDAAGEVGSFCSLSHERSGGTIYAAYFDAGNGALKVATREAATWTVQEIDRGGEESPRGKWTSIKVDALGNQHVAYYDEGKQNLKYAWFLLGGEEWTVTTLDAEGYVGANAQLAVNAESMPRVIYQDQDNVDVKLAQRDGSSWTVSPLLTEGTFGFWMSLEIDDAGGIVFSHYHPLNKDLLIYPPRGEE
jgi:hypothetical protein